MSSVVTNTVRLTCPVTSKLYSEKNPPYTLSCCSSTICLEAIKLVAKGIKQCPNSQCTKKWTIGFDGKVATIDNKPWQLNKAILESAIAFRSLQRSSSSQSSSQTSKISREEIKEPVKKAEQNSTDTPAYTLGRIRRGRRELSPCSLEEFCQPDQYGLLEIKVSNHIPLRKISIEFTKYIFIPDLLRCFVTFCFDTDSPCENLFKKLDAPKDFDSWTFEMDCGLKTVKFTPTDFGPHRMHLKKIFEKIKGFFPPDQAKILEPMFLKGTKK
jgi:hypothetical protein